MIDPARIQDLTITIDDVRRAGHCSRGAKTWFESHGLDFRTFLKAGISAEEFLATGDARAQEVVARTLKRRAGG